MGIGEMLLQPYYDSIYFLNKRPCTDRFVRINTIIFQIYDNPQLPNIDKVALLGVVVDKIGELLEEAALRDLDYFSLNFLTDRAMRLMGLAGLAVVNEKITCTF